VNLPAKKWSGVIGEPGATFGGEVKIVIPLGWRVARAVVRSKRRTGLPPRTPKRAIRARQPQFPSAYPGVMSRNARRRSYNRFDGQIIERRTQQRVNDVSGVRVRLHENAFFEERIGQSKVQTGVVPSSGIGSMCSTLRESRPRRPIGWWPVGTYRRCTAPFRPASQAAMSAQAAAPMRRSGVRGNARLETRNRPKRIAPMRWSPPPRVIRRTEIAADFGAESTTRERQTQKAIGQAVHRGIMEPSRRLGYREKSRAETPEHTHLTQRGCHDDQMFHRHSGCVGLWSRASAHIFRLVRPKTSRAP